MSSLVRICAVNNFKLKVALNGFIIEGTTPEQKMASFEKIVYDHNIKRNPYWSKLHKRSMEIQRPGRHQVYYEQELKRKHDRQQIAFFCKHVLATKDIKIPKN